MTLVTWLLVNRRIKKNLHISSVNFTLWSNVLSQLIHLLYLFSNYRKTAQSRTTRSAWTFCEFGPCITISKICVNKEVHPQTGFFKRRTEGACMTFCSSSGRGTASFERQWTTPGHTHCPRWQIANEKNLSHSVWSGRPTVVKHFIKSLLFGFIHTLGWKDTNKHAHNPPHTHTHNYTIASDQSQSLSVIADRKSVPIDVRLPSWKAPVSLTVGMNVGRGPVNGRIDPGGWSSAGGEK